ncbi:MAG TPA: response regulator transcription factor [bacterium]|nr:response regulator transcription factor [bacterium]HOX87604.1 response regulator transcription factor [bacterium]HPG47094.1 response regulator transcription factor [bacterium]HPM99582.1 response regulator transcription factor [bacterium]
MKKKSHILLVEDEENLARVLLFNLEEEGYRVTWARDGRTGLESFDGRTIDLVILDLMLPYIDGFAVAETIRRQSAQIPILMLTARTGSDDRIRGLESGADDYLTKPFHLKELLLRVNGMLKRKSWYRQSETLKVTLKVGKCRVDFSDLTIRCDKRTLRLTHQEAELLHYFVEHKGRIISRRELLENVWHLHAQIDTRTVDNFVARLRKYFEPQPSRPIHFISVRGAGYLYNP